MNTFTQSTLGRHTFTQRYSPSKKNILESFIQINIKKMVLIPLFIIGVSFKVGMMIG
jgi:hypothetical protein